MKEASERTTKTALYLKVFDAQGSFGAQKVRILRMAYHYRACAVDNIAPSFGVGIDEVNCGQQQLLLQVGALPNLVLGFAGLHHSRSFSSTTLRN